MLAVLTGTGLSAAAGLNAYIPFLVVALLARFTDLVSLPGAHAWIESWWAIAGASVLLLVEMVVDKIPAVDSLNDVVQTAIRPTVGALVFTATTAADDVEQSWTWLQDNSWAGVLLGLLVAGVVHGTKAAARPFVDAGSFGTATPVVSALEDSTSFGLSLVAVFWPVLVVLALGALGAGLVAVLMLVRRWRDRRRRRTGALA